MKPNFFLLLFLFAFSNAFSQFVPQQKIDSLKRILFSLQDTARIDYLNELSYTYTLISKQDSAVHYATSAYEEAKRVGYTHGIGESISRKAGIVQHFENNFLKEEELAKESLHFFDKTSNKKNIEILYDQLAFARFAQSFYDEAIGYLQKEYECYKKAGDEYGMGQAISFIGAIYVNKGDYDKGFDFQQQNLQLALKYSNEAWIKGALTGIGQLCLRIEDYPSALHYYREVLQNVTPEDSIYQGKGEDNTWIQMEFAETYTHLYQYDSALYRYNLFDSTRAEEKELRVFLVSKGEYYFAIKQYKNALQNFLKGLYYHKKLKDTNEIMRTLLNIGKTYAALQNNDEALKYAHEGLSLALQTKARQFIRDGYEILYSVYNKLHQTDSAFLYYRQYITMKDIVANDQVKGKFAAYNYEKKIELLNKEKQIQETKFKTETFHKKILIGGILTLLLLSIVTFRNILLKRRNEAHRREIAENELQLQKLESEKKQEELQHKATELEMQALCAQMNPHFIFNSLNAINHFILKNESETAANYLIKFSRLIRMVLNNSQKSFIPLEDELESLQLYVDLERLRFKNAFDYTSTCSNKIDAANICIPPLILQPFVENAIWHGLMHKETKGKLEIDITFENELLCCTISDNGIGRSNAAMIKDSLSEKTKSMGLNITKNRIDLINEKTEQQQNFIIHDLIDETGKPEGTKVVLKIKCRQLSEVYN